VIANLHNLTQPLIRYELTDRLVAQPAAIGHGHLRATAQGRADAPFRYGRLEVSPFAIRSVLATASAVREYQIRQTPRGLEARIVAEHELHTEVLTTQLRGDAPHGWRPPPGGHDPPSRRHRTPRANGEDQALYPHHGLTVQRQCACRPRMRSSFRPGRF
jgi:hypothetical protein